MRGHGSCSGGCGEGEGEVESEIYRGGGEMSTKGSRIGGDGRSDSGGGTGEGSNICWERRKK